MRASCVASRAATAPCSSSSLGRRLATPTAPLAHLPRRTLAAPCSASSLNAVGFIATAMHEAEARVDQWAADLSYATATTATRFQSCLLRVVLLLQRLVRWVQLASVAQRLLAVAATGAAVAATTVPPAAAAAAASSVVGFISTATTGAVEQLRHTLTGTSEGMEGRWSAIERTASSVQGGLFQAAQAHAQAVSSNPAGGMWKQAGVAELLSEEEKLQQAVFAQVYAELLQKGNDELSFSVQR